MTVFELAALGAFALAVTVVAVVVMSCVRLLTARKVDRKKFADAVRTLSLALVPTGALAFSGVLIAAKEAGMAPELTLILVSFDLILVALGVLGLFHTSRK